MRIIILSRNRNLYSTGSLLKAGRSRGHSVVVMDHMRVDISSGVRERALYYNRGIVKNIHAIIPRIGASATSYGSLVIRQFMQNGVFSVLTPRALMQSRNKFSCLQLLSFNDLPVPRTLISAAGLSGQDIYDILGPPPYVLKLLESTHGSGVLKAESVGMASSMVGAFMRNQQQIIIQEYVRESSGKDVRVLIVGGKVVAAMKRVAMPGEFRSNLHRGGMGYPVDLTPEEESVALRAADIMGLSVAGVDMLRSDRGPLILEVNASPGLEGIERVTKVDIAGSIFDHIEKRLKELK